MEKEPVSRSVGRALSWDADRVMIEPGHHFREGLLPECRHPEIGPAHHSAPIGKSTAQVKFKVCSAFLQPSPPATAGAATRRRGIQQGRKAADRREGKTRPQQQQDQLLQGPSVPASWCYARRQTGTGLPAAGAKVTGNRHRILLPGRRPVSFAGVVTMMPGMAPATVCTTGGPIALRISGQGDTVMLQGINTRYNTMQGRTSYGFGYRESLIHFPR